MDEIIEINTKNYWRILVFVYRKRIFTARILLYLLIIASYGFAIYFLTKSISITILAFGLSVSFLLFLPFGWVWFVYCLAKRNPESGFRKSNWLSDF